MPRPAPNRNNPAINSGIELTVASIGRARQIISVPAVSTRRQPKRDASTPAAGIAMIDPTPRHNNSRPRVPSFRFARALAYGTKGAQAAIPKPAIKKAMRVDICSSRPGTTGAGVGMAVMKNPWFGVQRTMSGATSLHIRPSRASWVPFVIRIKSADCEHFFYKEWNALAWGNHVGMVEPVGGGPEGVYSLQEWLNPRFLQWLTAFAPTSHRSTVL
ncbi:hypothetical protein PFLL34_00342 [Pseudomonas fluorescens]|nr:hypothetical protein PFLL34_00342 [Pseudomonas fluorescens]